MQLLLSTFAPYLDGAASSAGGPLPCTTQGRQQISVVTLAVIPNGYEIQRRSSKCLPKSFMQQRIQSAEKVTYCL